MMVRITEERNPNSLGIDEKPVEEILRIINAEDQKVPTAVSAQIPVIADAAEAIAATISNGRSRLLRRGGEQRQDRRGRGGGDPANIRAAPRSGSGGDGGGP